MSEGMFSNMFAHTFITLKHVMVKFSFKAYKSVNSIRTARAGNQGPVVQSVVSLMSSLVVKLL